MDNLFKGAWQLEEWLAELPDGNHVFPFGKDAVGRLIYDGNGQMSVQIMKAHRPQFATEDILHGEPEERMEAYKGFIGYSGTYEIAPNVDQITHHIEVSSYPNWAGREQLRRYSFQNGKLIMTAELESGLHRLTWRRATGV